MRKSDIKASALASLCLLLLSFALALSFLATAALHLFLLTSSLYLLWEKDLPTTIKKALGSRKIALKEVVLPLIATLLITGMLNLAAFYLGINDGEKIVEKVEEIPPILLFLGAVAVAPFTEELFFRVALLRKIGLLPSTALFASLHFAYGSWLEVMGAFLIGGTLAITAQQTKSLLPPIIVHAIYNFLAVIMLISMVR